MPGRSARCDGFCWWRPVLLRSSEEMKTTQLKYTTGAAAVFSQEMQGAAAGLCKVELETVRRKWGGFCAKGRSWLPLLEVDVGVALGLWGEKQRKRGTFVLWFSFGQGKGGVAGGWV
ncbi:hypothetical protein D5086_023700 [Populus alba]|uniref:Uncharacterized protein n=1 Tax=Populus alba TaxID=43335 RepID=A0ACC4BB01_POPAL